MSRSSSGNKLRCRLFSILLLSSALTPPGLAVGPALAAPEPAEKPGFRAFGESGYGYCDALVLSRFWKIGIVEAKLAIGDKILARNEQTLAETLGMAFSRHSCSQSFNLNDATKLADAWNGTGFS